MGDSFRRPRFRQEISQTTRPAKPIGGHDRPHVNVSHPVPLPSDSHSFVRSSQSTCVSGEQKSALDPLKHVNTIAMRISGSQAAKFFVRSGIRSYLGFVGKFPTLTSR